MTWLPWLPVLLAEALWVWWRTPRLPGATGPSEGVTPGPGDPFKLLVIGESTVAGVGAATHQEALAGQVAAALGRTVHWRAVGQNGVTARTAHALAATVPQERADAVVIALGVNDVLRMTSPRQWAHDLASLIAAIRKRTGPAPVVLAAVPPVGSFPAIPQPLRRYLGLRAEALQVAAQDLALTLDAVSYVTSDFSGGEEMFCSDRFHPSPLGYARWGAQIAKLLAIEAPGTSCLS